MKTLTNAEFNKLPTGLVSVLITDDKIDLYQVWTVDPETGRVPMLYEPLNNYQSEILKDIALLHKNNKFEHVCKVNGEE